MTTLHRCVGFLDGSGVTYKHTRHANAYRAREVAAAEHVPPYKLAKTVVFCGDDFYALAVLPADCMLDLDELGASLGLTRLRLATEEEIVRLFPGCEVGAMPPIGQLFNLPVYMDNRLLKEEHIIFSAGTHRDAIHMKMKDYILLAEPMITHFAYREAVAS